MQGTGLSPGKRPTWPEKLRKILTNLTEAAKRTGEVEGVNGSATVEDG
jgi:hypothetical protein